MEKMFRKKPKKREGSSEGNGTTTAAHMQMDAIQ